MAREIYRDYPKQRNHRRFLWLVLALPVTLVYCLFFETLHNPGAIAFAAPVVTTTDPTDGSTGVITTKTITVTFDVDVQAGAGYDTIALKDQGGVDVAFAKSIAANALTIDPTPERLDCSVTYWVYIPAGAVEDLANDPLAGDYNFSFTTEATPAVSSTDPTDGAADVRVNKTITVNFSKNIQAGTAYDTIALKDQGGVDAAFNKSIANNVLTIDPTSDLSCSVTYWVYVPAGSIADLSGNPTAGDSTFSFTTSPGKWYCELAHTPNDIGHWTSLALDVYGQPHVSYYYVTNGDLMYAYKDTTWHQETVDSTDTVGQYTSIALDDINYPHISYYDDTNDDLRYAYKDGSGWRLETVDSGGDVGSYTSIKLDASGYPHISYFDGTNGCLKYAYKDNSGWHTESIERIGGGDAWTSLVLDSSGYPHISYFYADVADLRYTYKDGSGWHVETVESSGTPGYYSSMALDASGYPHIAYQKGGEAVGGPTRDIKYAYKDAGGWHIELVDDYGFAYWTSITLDRSGYPHVGYWDGSNKYPRYAYKDGSGWHKETVPDGYYSGEFMYLALDASDNPRMTYYISVGDDLKYARWLTDAPTVTGTDPRRNAANVAIGKAIVLTFTEDVQEGDNYASITLTNGVGSVPCTKTLSGKTLTIDPDASLNTGAVYTVTIPAGAVKDTENKPLAADFSYSFTTESPVVVNSTDPAGGATGVRVDQTITVTFNKSVQAGPDYAQINLKHQNGSDVAFSKSIAGAVLTVDPDSDLANSVTYTVYVPASCVQDTSGTALASDNDFDFTTEAELAVHATDPASGATNVPAGKTITVTFSQEIQEGTSYETINVKKQDGSDVAFTKGIDGTTLTIDPDADLSYSVTYTVYIPADAVATLAGSGLPSDYSFSFTTEAGGSWQIETPDVAGIVGLYTSVALDVYGYPHISYFNDSNDDLKYAYKDASGWHTTIVDSGGSVGTNTSIKINPDGYPCISYRDDTNTDLKYAYKDAGGWHTEFADQQPTHLGANQTGLDFDSLGYPHISYLNYIDAGTYNLKHAWQDAGGWHAEAVDTQAGKPGQWSSLAIDSADGIHISYYLIGGNATLLYAYKPSGGAWSIADADPNAAITGEYSSIALDESDYPHFSCSDRTNWDLRYVYKDAGGWHRETENVDTADQVGTYTSIKVKDYYPRISYYDITNTAVKYAYKDGAGWHAETVDNSGSVGKWTSIDLDVSGNPHISYYDETNYDLRYAYWLPAKPTVAGVTPLRGAASIPVSKTIIVSFTESVVAGDNYAGVALKDQTGTDVPFTKTLSGRTLTIDPSGSLDYSVTYTVYVPAGSVRDSGGNALADDYNFTFTAEADTFPPAVSGTDPANGASGVPVSKTITVSFNEDVQAGENYSQINLKHQNGSDVSFGKSISGAVLTVDSDSNLSGSVTYTVYVPAGSVKDLTNNALASDCIFTFTTEAAVTTITLSPPAAIAGWSLDPSAAQPQTHSGALSVTVDPESTSWEATASDQDIANTNGKMTAWNGSYDTGSKLQSAMKVTADYEVTLPASGKIADGAGDRSVTMTFRQTVDWVDPPLTGGYLYRIVVTFTASVIV